MFHHTSLNSWSNIECLYNGRFWIMRSVLILNPSGVNRSITILICLQLFIKCLSPADSIVTHSCNSCNGRAKFKS